MWQEEFHLHGTTRSVAQTANSQQPERAVPVLRHNITFKKSLRAAERQRADVARARRRWIREQGLLDPAHLVFIDETAVSTDRAARG